MKHILIIICIFALFELDAQEKISVITHPDYIKSPRNYLSNLDSKLLSTKILLDYTNYRQITLENNGFSDVTVIKSSDWAKIQNDLKYASINPKNVPSVSEIQEVVDSYQKQQIYPLGILDFDFQYISQKALDQKWITEHEEKLVVNNESPSLLKEGRVVASSFLTYRVTGDQINFIAPSRLYLSNRDTDLPLLEVDFGNGDGFIEVSFDKAIAVDYHTPVSSFVEIVSRLTYDSENGHDVRYSHCTLLRAGTASVPKSSILKTTGYNIPGSQNGFCYPSNNNCKIRVDILYGSGTSIGNLRRPILMTDGFDPGNKRDYLENDVPYDSDLPYNHDTRGLYELFNGDGSAWEPRNTTGMVSALRNEGYDIIFCNFSEGAGNIITNAGHLKNVINQINSTLRDNKTEEMIVVGPSMGGLITRHALKTIENQGENHFVKTWIAFDSPMTGAYIPIGLQHATDFLSSVSVPAAIGDAAQKGLAKINSYAAKQLLVEHHLYSASSIHSSFFSTMNSLGYPNRTKRYSVTNGGTSILYTNSDDDYKILDFQTILPTPWVRGWAMRNDNGPSHKVFSGGKGLGTQSTSAFNHIGFDGAPGGYNTALYSLNSHPDNLFEKDPDLSANTRYVKTTFIPTTSALGITMTTSNINRSHNQYSVSQTPFDDFFGMGNNEQHVNITPFTKDRVINTWFHNDLNSGEIPRPRSGINLDQVIDNSVAYTYKNTVTFGGSDKITFNSDADVRVRATNLIKFEKDVYIKSGAIMNANTKTVNYGTVFRSMQKDSKLIKSSIPINILELSEFHLKKYDYSIEQRSVIDKKENSLMLSPNPTSNELIITYSFQTNDQLQILNQSGVLVSSEILSSDTNKIIIDVSEFQTGIYFLHMRRKGHGKIAQKFIKKR